MFGISLKELVIVALIAIIFVRPQDLPEIAYFLGKIYAKGKKFVENMKKQFENAGKETGFDEIRQEFSNGIVDEEVKNGDKDEIIDIYGNVHHVDLSHVEGDKEGLKEEVERRNRENKGES